MLQSNNMPVVRFYTRKLKLAFVILGVGLLAAACSDSAVSPKGSHHNKVKPHMATNFGLVAVNINIDKNGNITAEAKPAELHTAPPVAANMTAPSGGSHTAQDKGTIQTKVLSVKSLNSGGYGQNNGKRYIVATFAVKNADNSGQSYTSPIKNMTFIAAHVNTKSTGETALTELQKFDGTTPANSTTIAEHIIPTGQVGLNRIHKLIPTGVDVLQVFSESVVAGITTNPDVTLFPYGFNVINKHNRSRTITGNGYDGIIIFAFSLPLPSSYNNLRQKVYHYTFLFKPVNNTKARITQAPEEQGEKGRQMLADHIKNDLGGISNVDKVVVFPGSRFWQYGEPKTMIKCTPTRVAGTANPLNIITPLLTPDQMKQVGAYPGDGNIGDAITIHGCDFTGSENVTVGSQPATVTSSDPTHLVVDIPDGVTIGQSYDVTVDRSGTPYSAGDVHVNSAIVGSNATVTTDITGVCLGCTISNPTNVIDTDANTFSNMSLVLGLLGAGGYIDVTYSAADFPAGNRPGFVIKKGGGLLDASVLGDITITTYLNGSPQETKSGAGVLSLDLLKGGSKQFIGFKATKKFDEVRFTVSGTVALGSDFDVYRAYANYND